MTRIETVRALRTRRGGPQWGRRGRLLAVAAGLLLTWGSCSQEPGGDRVISDAHLYPQDDAATPPFSITQLDPPHGPVVGGTEVTVRGFGFSDGSRVFFGALMADPDFTIYEGPNRMRTVTPPGQVGAVDVRVLRSDGETTVFHQGYTYDVFSVDPSSGTMTGGTFIRIVGAGTDFGEGAQVRLGGEPLDEQTWVSPTLITGRTPPGAPGKVPVSVEDGGETITVNDAYTYYDAADPINGGLGGGPIDGEVNVTVLDAFTSEPVADAYVLMGADSSSPYQALTDATGRVSFSAPGLVGPQMLTVAANDYERASVVAFDARDVTLFLTPDIPPNPGTIPGQSWAMVQGFVSFGGVEFGRACDFDQMVPPAAEGERRVVKVYQTVGDYDWVAAEPGEAGTVLEDEACTEQSPYSYSIYARPGSFAVYALAGIENTAERTFQPYAMGIARNLVAGPDQVLEANILISHSLYRHLDFDISAAPPLDPANGPVGYKIRLFVDLGGDGFIVRPDTQPSTTDSSELVVVDALPDLRGDLLGGQFTAMVEAHNNGVYPYSKVYLTGLQPSINAVVVDEWHGVPEAVDPPPGGVPSSSRMIWAANGAEPSFNVVLVRTFPSGDPYWRVYLDGHVNQFVLPDLYGLGDGLDGHPSQQMMWHVISVSVEGMDFNDFSYRYLNDRYWSRTAGDSFVFSFPDL